LNYQGWAGRGCSRWCAATAACLLSGLVGTHTAHTQRFSNTHATMHNHSLLCNMRGTWCAPAADRALVAVVCVDPVLNQLQFMLLLACCWIWVGPVTWVAAAAVLASLLGCRNMPQQCACYINMPACRHVSCVKHIAACMQRAAHMCGCEAQNSCRKPS
jgi:hypothetical protein